MDFVLTFYGRPGYDDAAMAMFVGLGWITAAQYKDVTGKTYKA